jgi:DNA-binding NarL/FixJ family response regulator
LAIGAVARGQTYLSPAMSKHLVSDYRRRMAEQPDPLDRLTPRHREVLQLIAEGQTTKDIAARLKLSVKTVETHRAQLMDRLDIHDLAGLIGLPSAWAWSLRTSEPPAQGSPPAISGFPD